MLQGLSNISNLVSDKKIFITGARGFVGKNLCIELDKRGYRFLPSSRDKCNDGNEHLRDLIECDFDKTFDLSNSLAGCHTVIHCAGRAHIMKSTSNDSFMFDKVNHLATKHLAKQAISAGVTRFILISTAGVMGKKTKPGFPLTVDDKPNPQGDYAVSKMRGEEALISECQNTDMNYTIIRPPLIYGQDAPGNWTKLVKLLNHNLPLPLKGIKNKRSFIFIGNLIDLIIKCIKAENALNKTFLVCDNEDMSTSTLIEKIIEASNNRNRTFYISKDKLLFLARILGRGPTAEQLLNTLQLDITETIEQLNWKPRYSPEESIRLSIQKRNKR